MTVDIGREIGMPVPDPRSVAHQPLLEPLDGLQWSQAIELPRDAAMATRPAEIRRAWIHRAPESEVLSLFGAVTANGEPIASPWWLRALADGRLESRADGFRVEDRIAQLLSRRPGWEYVPWAADGESGYWEFMPSEGGRSGHRIPTTLLNTSRHDGWIDVLPAHSGTTPEPIAVAGLAGLRSRLGEFEAVR
ncbi:hypothetical protein FG385_13565 [Amycolatopsis alkalitolerans]|uniref:Uncharacterized protein n=2 Tax=Amycolatopsis alkalitolerans TaxID=2547244 RepID=A0A5C4M3Y6_9PSEU|nr:hypothetical protein FG385_13565 [Amycolatopsis alkalitolerans]